MNNSTPNRRDFIKTTTMGAAGLTMVNGSHREAVDYSANAVLSQATETGKKGAQRLSLEKLRAWEKLEYGMFIHFGMSTFDTDELSKGDKPSTFYAPDRLNVDQWVQTIRDAGMKYVVLTAKHVSGHCLWPTKHNDYNVSTSSNKTDVIGELVKACAKYGIMPGFYYCSWDNHNLFGSGTPTFYGWQNAFTTAEYRDFQLAQIEELIKNYGPWGEIWIDIPGVLGHDGRRKQYNQIARLQPDAIIMMNHGISDGSKMDINYAWPTDIMAIERYLPTSNRGYNPWFKIPESIGVEKDYYIPGEVCDPIGYEWFYVESDTLRPDEELLGMRLISRARKANLLLDVPPDKHGVIPQKTVDGLIRLRKNVEKITG